VTWRRAITMPIVIPIRADKRAGRRAGRTRPDAGQPPETRCSSAAAKRCASSA
jgi:hypothetical protein